MSKRIAIGVVASLTLASLPMAVLADGPATQPANINPIKLHPGDNGSFTVTSGPGLQPGLTTAATAPTTQPDISADAKALIDQSAAAYSKLKSLELAGVLKFDEAAGGEKVNHSVDFTASMAGHDRFRHETKDDVVAGANDKMQYFYKPDSQEYLSGPAAAADSDSDVDNLMDPLPHYFRQADPSLLLALSNHPAKLLLENVASASRVADAKIDSQSYPTLQLVDTNKSVDTILFDPTTHLIRQLQSDLKPELVADGQAVDHALITFDYTTTTPNAAIKDEAFAWSPPAGAQETPQDPAEVAVAVLKNKPAPDFSLTYLDGKPVSLGDFKGSVVVLDFWATWCGPCVESMPGLDALYQSKKADGLHVLAIDGGEEAGTVKDFVAQSKLSVPVVMDTDGKARDAYKIQAIPTKFVIGKDGVVTAIIIGAGDANERKLAKAVEAAMAK